MYRAKIIAVCAASLTVGIVLGIYLEHGQAGREKASAVDMMLSGTESSDAVAAARAIRVVQLIESGSTQEAVRVLSTPIADYYVQYPPESEDPRRSKLRTTIEEVIRTNLVLARVVKDRTEHITNGVKKDASP